MTDLDLIVAAVHKVDCGCDTPDQHTDDSLTYYAEVAEAVQKIRPDGGGHRYLSTACLHGRHDYCRASVRPDGVAKVPASCKFCGAGCECTECDHGESR